MKVFGYVRSAIPSPEGIAHQEREIREWAVLCSWEIKKIFDEQCPGMTWASDRQGARALLAALEPGDAVVVATADRLGRSQEIVRDFSDRIEARQATLYIIDRGA